MAYIRTNDRDLIQTGHLEDLGDGETVLVPFRKIVSKPMRNVPSGTGECASGDDHGTFIGTSGAHSVVRAGGHLCSVCVVRVIFGPATSVNQIGVSGTVSEGRTCAVLDHVRRTDEFAVWQTSALVLATARAGLTAVLPAVAGLTMTALAPLTLVRAPSASTTATTTLVQGALDHGDIAFG